MMLYKMSDDSDPDYIPDSDDLSTSSCDSRDNLKIKTNTNLAYNKDEDEDEEEDEEDEEDDIELSNDDEDEEDNIDLNTDDEDEELKGKEKNDVKIEINVNKK